MTDGQRNEGFFLIGNGIFQKVFSNAQFGFDDGDGGAARRDERIAGVVGIIPLKSGVIAQSLSVDIGSYVENNGLVGNRDSFQIRAVGIAVGQGTEIQI